MYIVIGATGHIGSQVVQELKNSGEKIIAVAHSDDGAKAIGDDDLVNGVAVDVGDSDALRAVFMRGERAFLLNPPAPPTTDTNAEELRTARSIAEAVRGSGLEKVVVASTYGALQGDAIGDLSVLWEFERLVEATGVPLAINRGAYYFTNIDMLVEPVKKGELPTPFPENFVLPMVSPVDLAKAAAARLTSSVEDVGIHYVEGPERYSFADVAAALSDALSRDVRPVHISVEGIEGSFLDQGFSKAAARAYTRMTLATLEGLELPANPMRGDVSLRQHIGSFMAKINGR